MQSERNSVSRDDDRSRSESQRGKRASFDPRTGEVRGSGSGAGGEGNPDEDYDKDPMAGSGAEPLKGPRPEGEAARRPIDPDEGV